MELATLGMNLKPLPEAIDQPIPSVMETHHGGALRRRIDRLNPSSLVTSSGATTKRISPSLYLLLLLLSSLLSSAASMRLDPGRIAARMRIEEEIEMDREAKAGRSRRQLGGGPKEETIQVCDSWWIRKSGRKK
jgi:hypothetical protein